MPPNEKTNNDDWLEYKRLVLRALEQSENNYRELSTRFAELAIAVATLKTQASVWGAIWGAAGGICCSIIAALLIARLGS